MNRIAPMDSPPSDVSTAGGRIVAPGACGEHSSLVFPALAETVVEKHLAGEIGGLLEDQT